MNTSIRIPDRVDIEGKWQIKRKILAKLETSKKESVSYLFTKYKKCTKCGTKDDLSIDHIIPVRILKEMGFYSIETYNHKKHKRNLTLLCRPCNNKKGDTLDLTDTKIRKLLAWYLKNYEKLKWTE